MSIPLQPAKLVSLKNSCLICPEEDFTSPQNLRKHILRFHDLQMPSRDIRMKHKDTNEIMYISQKLNHPNVKLHLACPSCLYSSELKEDLKKHVEAQHYSNKRNRSDVEPENHQKKKNCTDNISVPTTRNILAFTVMADNLYTPHQPKLAAETIKTLKPLVTISAGYNRNMSSNFKLKLEENLTAQASLASLKFFKNAFDLLKSALEKPRTSLPKYLWSQSIHTDMEEEQIIKIIQFTLTDIAGKCNGSQLFEPKHERTFWIDNVVFDHV